MRGKACRVSIPTISSLRLGKQHPRFGKREDFAQPIFAHLHGLSSQLGREMGNLRGKGRIDVLRFRSAYKDGTVLHVRPFASEMKVLLESIVPGNPVIHNPGFKCASPDGRAYAL